ncbi:MAG TPA: hypothetical protein VEX63_07190 [Flavisolibacter sp.]|nr:hypothetical protein [Flavisolibacter sp.]
MKTAVTDTHKRRFYEIRRSLDTIGSNEGSFVKIELLFFEALNIAKDYGSDAGENELLADLRKLQGEAYEKTNEHFKKRSQRELCIRKFISQFKRVISGRTAALS